MLGEDVGLDLAGNWGMKQYNQGLRRYIWKEYLVCIWVTRDWREEDKSVYVE